MPWFLAEESSSCCEGESVLREVALDRRYSAAEVRAEGCAEVGMETRAHCFPEDAAWEEIEPVVERLNKDEAVSGFFIQLPLPNHLDPRPLLSRTKTWTV